MVYICLKVHRPWGYRKHQHITAESANQSSQKLSTDALENNSEPVEESCDGNRRFASTNEAQPTDVSNISIVERVASSRPTVINGFASSSVATESAPNVSADTANISRENHFRTNAGVLVPSASRFSRTSEPRRNAQNVADEDSTSEEVFLFDRSAVPALNTESGAADCQREDDDNAGTSAASLTELVHKSPSSVNLANGTCTDNDNEETQAGVRLQAEGDEECFREEGYHLTVEKPGTRIETGLEGFRESSLDSHRNHSLALESAKGSSLNYGSVNKTCIAYQPSTSKGSQSPQTQIVHVVDKRQYSKLRGLVKYALKKTKEQPCLTGDEKLDDGHAQLKHSSEQSQVNLSNQFVAQNSHTSSLIEIVDAKPTPSQTLLVSNLISQNTTSYAYHTPENNATNAISQSMSNERTRKESKDCESRRKKKTIEGEQYAKVASEIFEKNQSEIEENCLDRQKDVRQAVPQTAFRTDTDSVTDASLPCVNSKDSNLSIHPSQSTTFDASTSGLQDGFLSSQFTSGYQSDSSVDPERLIKDTDNVLDHDVSDTLLSSSRLATSSSQGQESHSVDVQEFSEVFSSRIPSSFFANSPSTLADLASSALATLSSLVSSTGRQNADSGPVTRQQLVGLASILDDDIDTVPNHGSEINHMAQNRHRRFRPTQVLHPSTSSAQQQPLPQNIDPNNALPIITQNRPEQNVLEVRPDPMPIFLLNFPLPPLLLAQIRDAQGTAHFRQQVRRTVSPPPLQQIPPPPPPPPPPPLPPQLQERRQPIFPNFLDEIGPLPPLAFHQPLHNATTPPAAARQRHQYRRHSSSTR